jgi:hypothetical protein
MSGSIRHMAFSLLVLLAALACAQSWEQIPDMPVAVAAGQAVVHADRIYIISGYSDSLSAPVRLVQIYNPLQNTWQVQSMNAGGRHGFYLLSDQGQCIWGGGVTEEPLAQQQLLTWDFYASPTVWQTNPLFNRFHAAAFLLGDNIYLIGGYDPAGPGLFPYITGYDLLQRKVVFQDSTTFPDQVPYQQLAAVDNGQIYLFGGVYNSVMNRMYRFDPSATTLKRILPNMLYPRAAGQAIAIPDKGIYLVGGYNEAQAAMSSVEIAHFQSATAYTELGPALRTARKEPMAIFCKDYLYVFGGRNLRGETIRNAERLFVGNMTGVEEQAQLPRTVDLANNYPNPFNNQTCITVTLTQPQDIRVEIIAVDGRLVRVLAEGIWPAGSHRMYWDGKENDGKPIAAGVYFYRLQNAKGIQVKRMLYLP